MKVIGSRSRSQEQKGRKSLFPQCKLRSLITPRFAYSMEFSVTDLYKVPDAVPPINAESYHVATDKGPSMDGGKFRSIFSDNLQLIATRGKKARGTLLVDKHSRNGCSIKRAPLSVSYYNEISGGHNTAILVVAVVRRRVSAGPVVPLWVWRI